MIDLRSDTVTKPTPAMRQAMAEAEVGDDVYGEDPSVNRLQEDAARVVGKEAALFVPTGTMANQLAIRAQTAHGDVVLAGAGAHILRYESGAAAALSGVQIKALGEDGTFTAQEATAAIPPRDHHNAPATLVALENTHNAGGGSIWPIEKVEEVAAAAHECGLKVHLDGARLFNAVVASGVPAARWAAKCDSVSFCFSKGLGAPVGSILCGSHVTIERVRRFRKMFGGGMRQAGVIAAAARYALANNIDRLEQDHANARRLAAGLKSIGLSIEPAPRTNIVLFHCERDTELLRALKSRDLLVSLMCPRTFRAVTHMDVDSTAIDDAVDRCRQAISGLSP